MKQQELRQMEKALARSAGSAFDERALDGLPSPVASFFRSSVAPGTPATASARIRMRGRIKIGRWLPFRAIEVLTPMAGFVWAARAAGVISGSDRFVDGRGGMDWRLFGMIRVMHASGPDVSRSAAERAAAEAVWVPTSLLPGFGVDWSASGDEHITARYQIADYPVEIHCALADDARLRSIVFQRWGDPDGTGEFAPHPFGGEFSAHATFNGLTIPSEGRFGWHYGTDRWSDGEFFRYRITGLEPIVKEA
jgi:hypothetical protein